MRNFFVASILTLSVLAKGTDDGADRDNAVTTELYNVADGNKFLKMYLHTWNETVDEVDQLHGDLEVNIKDNRSVQEYGWCANMSTDLWDCMGVRTNLNPLKFDEPDKPEEAAYAIAFEMFDWYYTGADPAADNKFTPDTSTAAGVVDDASKNWKLVAENSSKKCTLYDHTTGWTDHKVVDCDAVIANWYRNFVTEEIDQDMQLDATLEKQPSLKIKGFFREHSNFDFSKPGAYKWGPEATIQPVTTKFATARAEAIKAAEEAKKKAEEEKKKKEEEEKKKEEEDKNKDGDGDGKGGVTPTDETNLKKDDGAVQA